MLCQKTEVKVWLPHQKPPLTQTDALHQWNQSRRSPHETQHNTEEEEDQKNSYNKSEWRPMKKPIKNPMNGLCPTETGAPLGHPDPRTLDELCRHRLFQLWREGESSQSRASEEEPGGLSGGGPTVQANCGCDLRQIHSFIALTELGFGLFQKSLQR